jgi:protein-tyrosine phosphatase
MDWITDQLALGSRREALDPAVIEREGVEAILTVYEDGEPEGSFSVPHLLHLHVRDGKPLPPDVLRRGTAFVREQHAAGRKVLVACALGISRSPTFVAACLHEGGMDLREAFATILQRRRQVLPHPALLRSLVECYGGDCSVEELLQAVVHAKRKSISG